MSTANLAVGESPGQKYARAVRAAKALIQSKDPRHVAMVAKANADLKRLSLTPGAVHVDSALANLSVQYANEDYIGTQLMPVVTVAKLSDEFFVYNKRDRLGFPDDSMSGRSIAVELNEGRDTDTYSCKPYAFLNFVDALTLANQDAPLNEMIDLVEMPSEGIAHREEMRIAAKMCTGANYGGNTDALSAGERWDTAGGHPIKDIQTAKSAIWMGRGPSDLVGFCSDAVWNVIARHPEMLQLMGLPQTGLATTEMVAGWFGLAKILVGKAWKDTANEGDAEVDARIWSDVFGIVRVARNATIRNASFGATMRFGQVATDQWFEQKTGTKGGYYCRVSVHEDHKIIAATTGFLLTTVIG